MQSHFSAQTLAEVFRDLYMTERAGALSLSRDEVEKRIYFERGLIVYADSDLDEEDLGYCLVDEGKISSGALEEARSNIDSPVELKSNYGSFRLNPDLGIEPGNTVTVIVTAVPRSE